MFEKNGLEKSCLQKSQSDKNLLRFSRERSQETRRAFATAHFHLDPSFMAGGQRGGMCVAVNFISSVISWSAG